MKHLLAFLLLLCSASVSAQDVIVKKDGSTILSKVLEVGQEEIKYKKHDNLEGPTYIIQKSELQAINYQNGAKDTFSAPIRDENRYLPNNQNDGTQQYNDRALLRIDASLNNQYKKEKTLRTVGWIGGVTLLCGSAAFIFAAIDNNYATKARIAIGSALALGGIAWTTAFILTANRQKKDIQMLQSSVIYQQNYRLPNGSSLSAGVDMLSDRTVGNSTIGLGLRYNF